MALLLHTYAIIIRTLGPEEANEPSSNSPAVHLAGAVFFLKRFFDSREDSELGEERTHRPRVGMRGFVGSAIAE